MKHSKSTIFENENWEADYWKGVLVLTELETMNYYTVQLKDTWTKQNITRFQFKEAVEKYGLDKACETFKKLSPEWKASLVHPNNLQLNIDTLKVEYKPRLEGMLDDWNSTIKKKEEV